MPNRNYIKGVKKERTLVNEARDQGKIAFRSAGSHSPIDVCVVDVINKKIEFFQCKPNNFSDLERKRIFEKCEALKLLNNEFIVSFEII